KQHMPNHESNSERKCQALTRMFSIFQHWHLTTEIIQNIGNNHRVPFNYQLFNSTVDTHL
ncbi:hypothetical protein KI387_001284, partial [Taxus chinensis]